MTKLLTRICATLAVALGMSSALPLLAQEPVGISAETSATKSKKQRLDTSGIAGNNVDVSSNELGEIAVEVAVPGTVFLPVDETEETELHFSLQQELNRLGCDAGPEDGDWGRRSEDALARLRGVIPQLAHLDPSLTLLALLDDMPEGTCPVICSAREVKVGRECKLKTCTTGQYLDSRGDCKLHQARAKATTNAGNSTRKHTSGSSGRKCATYNGRSYCN